MFLLCAFVVGVFMKINPHRGAIGSGVLNITIILPSTIFFVRQEPDSMIVALIAMMGLVVVMLISQQSAYLVVSDLHVMRISENDAKSRARVLADRHLMSLVIISLLSVSVIDIYPIVLLTVLFGVTVGLLRFNFGDYAQVDLLKTT